MPQRVEWIKTDFVKLNYMLGGGIPKGKILEIFGFEGCGKTTLALELSKHFEKVYYIDYEHEIDIDYVEKLGAKVSRFTQPVTFEEGVDNFFKDLRKEAKKTKTKNYDLLIVDTIGSAVSEVDIESDMSGKKYPALPGKVTIFCKKLEKICKPMGLTTILLNHKKVNLGDKFGPKYRTPGGRQIKYSASIRISVTEKKERIFTDSIITNLWWKKNKVAENIPIKHAPYIVRRGKGIIRGEETFRLGLEIDLIKRAGNKYSIKSKEFTGKKETIDFLENNPKIREAINGKWLEKN